MRLRDLPAWKPIWYGDELSVYVEGEVGILTDATNVGGRALSLMITYQGREYNGWLAADPPIIEEIFPLIKKLAGHPVAKVADIEIHTSSAEAPEASSEPQRKPDEKRPPEYNRNEVSSPLKEHMNDTEGRESRLQSLLASIRLEGTENYQREIGEIRTMPDLTEKEREIIKEIVIAGWEQARREGRNDKASAYRRLARRLILRQPLNDVTFPTDAGYGNVDHPDDAVAVAGSTPIALTRLRHNVALKSRQSRSSKLITVSVGFCLMLVASFFLGRNLYQRVNWNEQPDISHLQRAPTEEPSPMNRAEENFSQTAAKREPRISSSPRSSSQGKVSRRPLPASPKARTTDIEKRRKVLAVYKVRRNVPLRARPQFSSPVVDRVIEGTTVKVLGFRGDWLNIQLSSESRPGFIRKEFAVPIANKDLS